MPGDYAGRGMDFARHMDNRRNNEIILQTYGARPQETDFADIYSAEIIERDRMCVEKLQNDFQKNLDHLTDNQRKQVKERQQTSEVLEAILAEHGEASNWFGDSAFVSRTTEYDDIHNGVDATAEFNLGDGESETLALAIDASTNSDVSTVNRKITRCYERVAGGSPAQKVKYFSSQVSEYRGALPLVVPVVVGLEAKNMQALIEQCVETIRVQQTIPQTEQQKTHRRELRKQLEQSPVQMVILGEISTQLKNYQILLERLGDKHQYLESIKKLTAIIDRVLRHKSHIKLGQMEQDLVYERIEITAGDLALNFTSEDKKTPTTTRPASNIRTFHADIPSVDPSADANTDTLGTGTTTKPRRRIVVFPKK